MNRPKTLQRLGLATVVAVGALTSTWLASGRGEKVDSEGKAQALPAVGNPPFLSPHHRPIAAHGGRVYVANTPSDTVDVIDAASKKIVARVDVGIDPVGLAVRPDGSELWVANHVSDSVSVIDIEPASPTYLQVVATVQDINERTKATAFDEPVGIAFASDIKAYVALSSENKIAVVDVKRREVKRHLTIPAQDPRAIAVRDGRLYVLPFESNNKTQLSGGYKIDGELVTFNAHQHSIARNNVLSLGHVTDIVKHPRVPDKDLFVFDTKSDELVTSVDTLGTLLYGLAVGAEGKVYVAQTDARNDINGRSGTEKHDLSQLGNRAFLNQITHVRIDGEEAGEPKFFDLEPLPPLDPEPGQALATPYAVEVTTDGKTLVAAAAASDTVFTVDAETGEVLGRVEVDAVPRGIALDGEKAWVLNAVANTVSMVDCSDRTAPKVEAAIALHDPTHPVFKRGRIAFESASAATTKTFSCASCHPDGHTDQLLWVLKTPVVTGGNQIMPRSTMPVRGLRDTAPFHWDGIPGDPYGGNNSQHVYSSVDPNCELDDPVSAARHLVDGSLGSTMAKVGAGGENDEGKAGALDAADRDALSEFLLSITYPPAQRRAYTNELTKRAQDGFRLFHIRGNDEPDKPKPNVCGDCHRMPFLVSTNTPGTGMDAPTWRGAYDRFLILPQGRLNIIDFDFYRRVAERGQDERSIWRFSWQSIRKFDPIWEMVLEGSTGHSGAFARQVTIDEASSRDEAATDLLEALEEAGREGAIVLTCEGAILDGDKAEPVRLQYRDGKFVRRDGGEGGGFTPDELVNRAAAGRFIGTFTGRHGAAADHERPQPALWTLGPIHAQSGRQDFPVVYPNSEAIKLNARHLQDAAHLVVDGRRVDGAIRATGEGEEVEVKLATLPQPGMHFLQVQNPGGMFSNDFIFHVAEDAAAARAVRQSANPDRMRDRLAEAIARGDIAAVERLLDAGAPINDRQGDSGTPPLGNAAFRGEFEIAKLLIDRGAEVSGSNNDETTPLHIAAFMCREEIVDLLIENGASLTHRNNRRERPEDSVAGEWSEGLARVYQGLGAATGVSIDLEYLEKTRPLMLKRLRDERGISIR